MKDFKVSSFVVEDSKIFKSFFVVNSIDSTASNSSCAYDFFDKNRSHFSTLLPYQFLYRPNRSYDFFLLSMNYELVLTYYVCYFNMGSTVKSRFNFPFYKFNN
jgi:hypothetical protein